MSATVVNFLPAGSALATIRAHEQQARAMSVEYANELLRELESVAAKCAETAGLSALPAGVTDRLRRLAEHIAGEVQGVEIITRKSL